MKVLVAIEDVLFGTAIADWISHHKWPQGTEFRIVHVIDSFTFRQSMLDASIAWLNEAKSELVTAISKVVDDVANSIKLSVENCTVTPQIIEADPSDEILAIADEWPADLIVAGSHGRKGFNRLFLGSTSLALTSYASCPVLLVKPDSNTLKLWAAVNQDSSSKELIEKSLLEVYQQKKLRKILIAVDETDYSRNLIDFINKHEWCKPTEYLVLRAYKTPPYLSFLTESALRDVNQDAIQEQKSSLRRLALKLRDHFHSPRIEERLVEGDPKTTIIEVAKEWGADLIVVGKHSEPMQKALMGSVSLAVLSNAPCSVLLLQQLKAERVKNSQHAGTSFAAT